MCETVMIDDSSRIRRRVLAIMGHNIPDILHFYLKLASWTRLPLVGPLFHFLCEEYGKYYHGGQIQTLEECEALVDKAHSVTAVDCACRKTFHNCEKPLNVCLTVNTAAEVFSADVTKNPKVLTKAQAKEVLRDCQKNGLVHAVHHCIAPNTYAICNCCSCCCVPMRMKRDYLIENGLQNGNYQASIDENSCISCGKCAKVCPVGAITFTKGRPPVIDLDKCLGCGLCRDNCDAEAITLVKREHSSHSHRHKDYAGWQKVILYGLLLVIAFPMVRVYQLGLKRR